MKEDDQPLRNRSISFKSAADIKKIFGQGNIKEPRKRNYDFNLESRDYELYLEKVSLYEIKKMNESIICLYLTDAGYFLKIKKRLLAY